MLERLALSVLLPGLLWAQGNVALVGRWRSLEVSKGGIGAMYSFRADGSMTFSPGATVDMPYRIEGEDLVLPSDTKGGKEQRSKIGWRGVDNLRLISPEGEEGFQRSGYRADPNKLIGEWVGSREMAGARVEVRWRFNPDGTSLLLIPFTTQQGRYTASNGNLNISLGQKDSVAGTYKIDAGVLSVSAAGNRVIKLARY